MQSRTCRARWGQTIRCCPVLEAEFPVGSAWGGGLGGESPLGALDSPVFAHCQPRAFVACVLTVACEPHAETQMTRSSSEAFLPRTYSTGKEFLWVLEELKCGRGLKPSFHRCYFSSVFASLLVIKLPLSNFTELYRYFSYGNALFKYCVI